MLIHSLYRGPVYRVLNRWRGLLPSYLLLRLPDLSRTDVLRIIAAKTGSKAYLEIGVSNGRNWHAVPVSQKFGVDPAPPREMAIAAIDAGARYFQMSSDAFFRKHAEELFRAVKLDLVFIDGLHEYAQVIRDIQNVVPWLSSRAVLVLHDCNPQKSVRAIPALSYAEAMKIAGDAWDGYWCGDVWKVITHLRNERPEVGACVLDCDFGLGILPRPRALQSRPLYPSELYRDMSFDILQSDRKTLLGLVVPSELLTILGRV